MTGIDLNTVEEEEAEAEAEAEEEGVAVEPPGSYRHRLHDRNTAPAPEAAGAVCLELWHACAGPLATLPKKGSAVVYLPQGHIEHLGERGGAPPYPCSVPPHVLCRVVDVQLHADAATDDVYVQLSLMADTEEVEQQMQDGELGGDGEVEDLDSIGKSSVPHMFCKTLTASDTSTHGGFSVPRRAAEDCFPPLDYKQQRPSQDLIAKDLHGVEWKFRHIYRGQPRRHLLTTGWSAFVNKKKLVSGDAVLFLRSNDGELRLGIRRATQLRSGVPYSVPCIQSSNFGSLATVANAVSKRTVFYICYSPRDNLSEFIIPYWKFTKSFTHKFSIGTRFKVQCESEDTAERRYTGLITGIGDMDPVRWPGSKWRCLLVRWDDGVNTNQQNRVSPWEIEPTGSVLCSNGMTVPGSKRTKICLPSDPDIPIPNRPFSYDLRESARFHKVLQGQEIMGFRTPYIGIDVANPQLQKRHQFFDVRRCTINTNDCVLGSPPSHVRVPIKVSDFSNKCIGFGESIGFHKVLQGQEMFQVSPPYRRACVGPQMENGEFDLFENVQTSTEGHKCPAPFGCGPFVHSSKPSAQVSSPCSVLLFRQANHELPYTQAANGTRDKEKDLDRNCSSHFDCSRFAKGTESSFPCRIQNMGSTFISGHSEAERTFVSAHDTNIDLYNDANFARKSCRLFGFPLTERISISNGMQGPLPSSLALTGRNFKISSSPSGPQMQAKPMEHSCNKVR